MMQELAVDDVDRRIAAALQVNGRAAWGEIGRALDLPERTVARRGQALFDRGLVKVSTYVDVAHVLHARAVILRITTEPGALWEVARTLSRRDDASSVSVLEGSSDVAGMLLPRDDASIRQLLFDELPRIRGMGTVNVARALKFYRSGHDWVAPGVLSDAEIRVLRTPEENEDVDPGTAFSAEEYDMLALLQQDGRMPIAQLARELGLGVSTARRRLDSLTRRGLMHPRTEVIPRLFGLGLEALVWLRAPMNRLEEIGAALGRAPEVKFVVATTGTSQLLMNTLVADEDAFYEFLTGPAVAGHAGLEVVESLVVVTPVLRGSLMVDEGPQEEGISILTGALRI